MYAYCDVARRVKDGVSLRSALSNIHARHSPILTWDTDDQSRIVGILVLTLDKAQLLIKSSEEISTDRMLRVRMAKRRLLISFEGNHH